MSSAILFHLDGPCSAVFWCGGVLVVGGSDPVDTDGFTCMSSSADDWSTPFLIETDAVVGLG